jgi:mannose-1-phosphate guanylyltransferase
MPEKLSAHAVILAGGRGTRFWPRSRTRTPKQLLNIVGKETMLQQTARRLAPVFPPTRLWVVTNDEQVRAVRRNLPRIPARQALSEPVGRNTAAAIALAAIHIQRTARGADALMAVLPADHFIADAARYQRLVRAALEVAAQGPNLVVLGVPPAHPETGFGYIERAAQTGRPAPPVYEVKRFTEKPSVADAQRYVAAGNYYWNAGMFFWRVSTFLDCLQKHLPKTHAALARLAEDIGTSRYARALHRIYPRLESISVDYALMEPATRVTGADSRVFVIPAEVGWSDIGSWSAVYDLLAKTPGENVSAGPFAAIDAQGNFLWSPKKFIGAVGVRDLILVETGDAILLCPRSRAQDVGKLVQWLEKRKLGKLL